MNGSAKRGIRPEGISANIRAPVSCSAPKKSEFPRRTAGRARTECAPPPTESKGIPFAVGQHRFLSAIPGKWILLTCLLLYPGIAKAAVLWSDLGATLAHETGAGNDVLGGALKRDDSATDALYFKFHIDPLSDASTEEYFAAFELYEGGEERLAVGNALKAWAYTAFNTFQRGDTADFYIDLHSSRPEPSGSGGFFPYENPHRGLEVTIVFKVQYVTGGDDVITVWLNPDLGPGASEASQSKTCITEFVANASFDEIHLRHGGGGEGWMFSEMMIANSFADFVAPAG